MDERFESITDQVDFYLNLYNDRGHLSDVQREHLIELRDALFRDYGAAALKWINAVNEIL